MAACAVMGVLSLEYPAITPTATLLSPWEACPETPCCHIEVRKFTGQAIPGRDLLHRGT